jgi:hypothetical protein
MIDLRKRSPSLRHSVRDSSGNRAWPKLSKQKTRIFEMIGIFPLGKEAMNFGSQSKRSDGSIDDSGWRRISSKMGLEKMRSTRLSGVIVVCCHILVERDWRKSDRIVSMAGKCCPDVERWERRRLRTSRGGDAKLFCMTKASQDCTRMVIPFQRLVAAAVLPPFT